MEREAAHAYTKSALADVPQTNRAPLGDTIDFSEHSIFAKISHRNGDGQNEVPTPAEIERAKQVAQAMDLLKQGKYEDLCKLAKEIGKDGDDNALGSFQKQLSKEAKMNIQFNGNTKSVDITFGDHDPNARDKRETSTTVTIKADGTLVSAKETKSGGNGGQRDEVTDVDPAKSFEQLKKRIEKNSEQK
jgi:hypothetical protein